MRLWFSIAACPIQSSVRELRREDRSRADRLLEARAAEAAV